MNNANSRTNQQAAARAVREGALSAAAAYGWTKDAAYETAVRETAAEFGWSVEQVEAACARFWG